MPKSFENLEETSAMRFLPESLAPVVALLVVSQVVAVTIESQAAALLSWSIVYTLLVTAPPTLSYEGFRRYYQADSEKGLFE